MKGSKVFYWLVPPAILLLNSAIAFFFCGPPHPRYVNYWDILTGWFLVVAHRYHYPYPGLIYFAVMGWLIWKWYKDPCFFWAFCLFLVCLVCGPTGNILAFVGH